MSQTPLSDIAVFVAVVDAGSFSGAARALGVSKSHVSKRVAALEDHLGARLLNRTTRRLAATDLGRAFYERSARALADLRAAERAVTDQMDRPTGLLRVSAPVSFGVRFLSSAIADFLTTCPDLKIELSLNDRLVDLIDDGFDLVVRIGALADSSHIARRLAPLRAYVVASPGYLEANGHPQHPDELRNHRCLRYTLLRTGPQWHFRRGEELRSVPVDGPLLSNNGDVLLEATLAGVGIIQMPEFFAARAIHDGRLVPLFEDWDQPDLAVWALYPHSRHLSPKVRAFVDFMVDRFKPVPPWKPCAEDGAGA